MRNLRNIGAHQWSVPAQFQGRDITASTWDLANDSIICTIGPSQDNPLVELVRVNSKSGNQYLLLLVLLLSQANYSIEPIISSHLGMLHARIRTWTVTWF